MADVHEDVTISRARARWATGLTRLVAKSPTVAFLIGNFAWAWLLHHLSGTASAILAPVAANEGGSVCSPPASAQHWSGWSRELCWSGAAGTSGPIAVVCNSTGDA